MKVGSIVKIHTEVVFDDRTMRRNKAPWMYGVLTTIEDECEVSREKIWQITWASSQLFVTSSSTLHLASWCESDLTLVREPHEDHMKLDKYYDTSDFFEKEHGLWKTKPRVIPFCEYCRERHCDRMNFWGELASEYEKMYRDNRRSNNRKRKYIYCAFVMHKHGILGYGMRVRIPTCILKYCRDMFPPPAGQGTMGHRDA